MRVGIVGLLHESNTFVSRPTTLEHFRHDTLLCGSDVRDQFTDSQHELGGFFAGLSQQGIEAVPIFVARATPYGTIEDECFAQLISMLQSEVAAAGQLDGLLVAPHGAAVSASHPDADGYWLAQLRQQIGTRVPMIGTLDLHANLSPSMVQATDALIAYRTNPHLDQRARGWEAAVLMGRTLSGEVSPVQHAEFPSMAISIDRQMTEEPPLAALYQLASDQRDRGHVLANSILLGFPYADVPEMGSAVLAVADQSKSAAADAARELVDCMWQSRQDLASTPTNVDEALAQAQTLTGPVCLLDMGDNVGGGSPGDSTHLLHAIRQHQVRDVIACLCDPQAVADSRQAGIGARIQLAVGGKTDSLHGLPYEAYFEVQGFFDGKFAENEVRHGGQLHFDQGPSAVVRSTDPLRLTILLTSFRVPPFSLQQLTSCDLDPRDGQMVIAKGVNAPIAAYAPVCRNFVRVNTPGCTTADMRQLGHTHRRKPMFPFEPASS